MMRMISVMWLVAGALVLGLMTAQDASAEKLAPVKDRVQNQKDMCQIEGGTFESFNIKDTNYTSCKKADGSNTNGSNWGCTNTKKTTDCYPMSRVQGTFNETIAGDVVVADPSAAQPVEQPGTTILVEAPIEAVEAELVLAETPVVYEPAVTAENAGMVYVIVVDEARP